VREQCKLSRDTIDVAFHNTPPDFTLGDDEVLCKFKPVTLKSEFGKAGFDFTWQDGSKDSIFVANEFGVYWLKIENPCGVSADTISYTQSPEIEFDPFNFISPDNGDLLNQYFILDKPLIGSVFTVFNRWGKQVYTSTNYQNDWDGGGMPAGIYFYTVTNECVENRKGTLTIRR
jgi:hypothetical protein